MPDNIIYKEEMLEIIKDFLNGCTVNDVRYEYETEVDYEIRKMGLEHHRRNGMFCIKIYGYKPDIDT